MRARWAGQRPTPPRVECTRGQLSARPREDISIARATAADGAAEVFAWRLLRDLKMLGLKFRRQHVLCGYEVDFYCAALRLVVEIDGAVHDDAERAERDARRTTILARRGVRGVRLENARLNRETLREAILPFTCPLSLPGERDGG